MATESGTGSQTDGSAAEGGAAEGGGASPEAAIPRDLVKGGAAGSWELDPAGTSVAFTSKSIWGLVTVHGRFGAVHGSGRVAEDGTAAGDLVIGTASVDTGNTRRDDHLRSGAILDAEAHPEIVYRVQGAGAPESGGRGGGVGVVRIEGVLTVHGVGKPLPLEARILESGPDAVTLTADVAVDRGEFGVGWNPLGMAPTATAVTVTARFLRR